MKYPGTCISIYHDYTGYFSGTLRSIVYRNGTIMSIYYVYQYNREDGTPYYIGKGKGNRIHSKQKNINLPTDPSRIIVVKDNLTEEESLRLEIELIKNTVVKITVLVFLEIELTAVKVFQDISGLITNVKKLFVN